MFHFAVFAFKFLWNHLIHFVIHCFIYFVKDDNQFEQLKTICFEVKTIAIWCCTPKSTDSSSLTQRTESHCKVYKIGNNDMFAVHTAVWLKFVATLKTIDVWLETQSRSCAWWVSRGSLTHVFIFFLVAERLSDSPVAKRLVAFISSLSRKRIATKCK